MSDVLFCHGCQRTLGDHKCLVETSWLVSRLCYECTRLSAREIHSVMLDATGIAICSCGNDGSWCARARARATMTNDETWTADQAARALGWKRYTRSAR